MTDKGEHRAALHKIVVARAGEGKPSWAKTVNVTSFIHYQYSDELAVNVYHILRNVAALIVEKLPQYADPDKCETMGDEDFAIMLSDMGKVTLQELREADNPKEIMNDYLNEVYDVFDYKRIWAEPQAPKIVKMLEMDVSEAPAPKVA